MGFSEKVVDIAQNGFQQSEVLLAHTLYSIRDHGEGECSHLLYGAILHIAGGMKFIASVISKGKGEEKIATVNKECMLAAGLIAARCVQVTKQGIALDFSPRNVLAAITAANKIACEEDFERHFDQAMMDCYKQGTAERGMTYDNYWDYLDHVTPDFDDFAEELSTYTATTRH